MPGTTPQISDVYFIDFQALGFHDPKATPRRSAIVSSNPVGVGVIGRQSKKPDMTFSGDHLYSPINPNHVFDLEGYWMSGHYKTVFKSTFASEPQHFDYVASLTEPERTDLLAFVADCRRNKKIL